MSSSDLRLRDIFGLGALIGLVLLSPMIGFVVCLAVLWKLRG